MLAMLLITQGGIAQYTLNGSAVSDNCHCYTLTPDLNNQGGSVWNNFKIDLTQSFHFNFDIYLGCNDAGADGIVFVLQPVSTSIGSAGGGLGYQNVSPSVGVSIDTWQNSDAANNDPAYDHIAIQLNGNLDHTNSSVNIAGPETVLPGIDNIEDCQWHTLRVEWDATAKNLTAWVDGQLRVTANKNLVTDVFGGQPLVFWGFTGSTGGARNRQQFCTSLTPQYRLLPNQKRCFGEPVQFFDSTVSFTTIQKLYWDFGDGSPIDSITKNPVHVFSKPGNYTVKQTAIGADGCVEIGTSIITIGSKPMPGFTIGDSCVLNNIIFTDTSKATVGTINNWYWQLDDGFTSVQANPSASYLTGGYKNIRLAVKTAEGCLSDTISQTVYIFSRPVLDFSFTDSVCTGTPVFFTSNIISSNDTVRTWVWNFGGTDPVNTPNAQYTFDKPGLYTILLGASANGNAGCLGVVTHQIFVRSTPVAAFTSNDICQGVSSQLTDSSYNIDNTPISQWWWQLDNGLYATVQHPVVLYNQPGVVTVRMAVTAAGCVSDTITKPITIWHTPVAAFGYHHKICENEPLQFTDSSAATAQVITAWHWLYNNNIVSNLANPVFTLDAGNQQLGLTVTTNRGCVSDTVFKTFFVNIPPVISMGAADGCKDALLTFTAAQNGGSPVQQWYWDFADGSSANTTPAVHTYTSSGQYPVVLVGTSAGGCTDTASQAINIYSTNAFAGNDTLAAANQPVQLQATGGLLYEWSPASSLNNINIANPVATGTSSQVYRVRAYTPAGCESFDEVAITIFNQPDLYVPTAFSPDGNGLNDIFKVIPVGIARFDNCRIYNQYGQLIFSTSNARQGWDGTYRGKPQPAGTYVWVTSGINYKGLPVVKKGTVVLIR
ncbi:MAG: hypothetical protein RL172_502 [Bacteroidota bacterium]|jgi:gliding motility-associated-like protein